LNQQGSAVVAGVVNIAMATLVTLSMLALAMAGYYNLVITDHAVAAASNLSRYGSAPQERYLLKRLELSLPELATYEVQTNRGGELSLVTVRFGLPGLGLLSEVKGEVSVAAATERL
jgi:hypothetical protein